MRLSFYLIDRLSLYVARRFKNNRYKLYKDNAQKNDRNGLRYHNSEERKPQYRR